MDNLLQYIINCLNTLGYTTSYKNIKFMLDFSLLLINILYDYLTINPLFISNLDFYEYMNDDLFLYLLDYFYEDYEMNQFILFHKYLPQTEDSIFDFSYMILFQCIYPLKKSLDDINFISDKEKTSARINALIESQEINQRSLEWYKMRSNLLTASNIYKCFGTTSEKNQLIFEKCKEYIPDDSKIQESRYVNIDSSLQYGVRYEQLSVLIYEKRNLVEIGMFGCIIHDTYKFLGASPDGIIITQQSPKFGRLVEIKNPKSRVITDDIKWEYWCQVQLQLEVCDLDIAEFLETRFVEYQSEYDYNLDGTFTHTVDGKEKGIILYFCDGVNPIYEYKPLDMGESEYEIWFETIQEKYKNTDIQYAGCLYWKLDIYQVLYIERNRKWFRDNLSKMENIWNIICYERENGFSHRRPTPRVTKQTNTKPVCHPSLLFNKTESINADI